MTDAKRIRQLPSYLANQIAAGEVIERPASVLKELLENSLDAGSQQIEITIERSGIGLIRVQDNGSGICKEDLKLAIVPHATSKIETLSDLEQVISYGFRGEALASMSAVSRLQLSSSVSGQEFGWCLSQEGREALPKLMPTPKRKGTLVEVRDLFYNTPARRKFLRSDKTEMGYLEEIFKRIALSQPGVAFKYQQGERLQKRLPACRDFDAHTKRVGLLCGQSFVEQAYYVQAESNGLKLNGWLGSAKALRSQADLQYFYVNGRIVRDKVVMHAVRQAYQDICLPGRYPAYVLYFELDPSSVDVNVHPTKHEVRFREARTVHAFLSYAIQEGLKQGNSGALIAAKIEPEKIDFSSFDLGTVSRSVTGLNPQTSDLGTLLCVLNDELMLLSNKEGLAVVDIKAVRSILLRDHLKEAYFQEGVSRRPLLMPVSVVVGKNVAKLDSNTIDWERLGFEMTQVASDVVLLRSVPVMFGSVVDKVQELLFKLLEFNQVEDCIACIVQHVIENQPLSETDKKQLLEDLKNMDYLNPDIGSRRIFKQLDLAELREALLS